MPKFLLPIELCEVVIDNLDEYDTDTQRACSLACRAFLPASRRLLFYHVDLHNRDVAQSFLDIICSIPSPTSPIRYIRNLCLREERRGDKWVNKALPLLAERLTEFVTILEFDTLMWNLPDNIGQITILSSFLKVRSLTMTFCKFESSKQMNQFIASFPSLDELDCSQTYWTDGPLILTADLPQGLRSLTMDSKHSLFFHRLLSRELHPSVRTLRFHYMYREHTEDIGILLKKIGSSLEELRFGNLYTALGVHQGDYEDVFSRDINLAHNTHLRVFQLKMFHREVYPLTCQWVITLLAQITPASLVEMWLEFQVEDISLLNIIDWTQLENVFNQQQWSNLEILRVCWYGLPRNSGVREFIKARFPVLEGRGILKVW